MHYLKLLIQPTAGAFWLLLAATPVALAAPPSDFDFTLAKKTAPANKANAIAPKISLIAIGDAPGPRYEIKDERRHLIPLSQDELHASCPPDSLYTRIAKNYDTLLLGLNSPAFGIRLPAAPELTLYGEKDDSGEPFIKIPLPPKPDEDLIVFLLRNPETAHWRKSPIARVLKNGLQSFPLNSVRVTNLTHLPLQLEILGNTSQLDPQGTTLIPIPRAEQGILTYRITTGPETASTDAETGGDHVIADTAITYPFDARVNLVAYHADGPDKTHPIRLMTYHELPQIPVPAPVPPPPAKATKKKK